MSNGSLSNKDTAQSAINSIASFANSIVADGSSHLNSISGSASSQSNSGQVKAINLINSIAKNADQEIGNLTHVGDKHKRVTKIAVKKYLLHTKSLIQSSVRDFAIKNIITNYRNDVNRILNIIRIDNLYSLVVVKLKSSDLSSSNRKLAIKEIVNIVKRTRMNISRAISKQMINDSFVSGINAINGSLSKYVSNNKNNILKSFSKIVSVARTKMNSQRNLSLSAKSLANQEINRIYIRVRHSLHSVNNITSVNDVKRQGIMLINRILVDQGGILGKLTNFDSFNNQAKDQINDLVALASNSKHQINQFINHIQNSVDGTDYSQVSDINFDYQERKVAKVVLSQFIKDIRLQLGSFNSYINRYKQNIIINQIKDCSLRIYDRIRRASGSSIEIELSKGIQSLKSFVGQSNYSMYVDFIGRLVKGIRYQISQMPNLSLRVRNQAENQIQSIVKLARNKFVFDSKSFNLLNNQKQIRLVENQFHRLINHNYLKSSLVTINQITERGQQEVKDSNLSPLQKQQIVKRIDNCSANIRIKIIRSYKHQGNIESKLNFGVNQIDRNIKNSLIDDKNNNFDRIHQFIKLAYSYVNRMENVDSVTKKQFNSALNQIVVDSGQKINGADSLSKADRIEQVYENQIYYQIGQVVNYSNHSKGLAIKLIFHISDQAVHQVNFSNLSLIQKWTFNNKINRHANLYVRKIITVNQFSQRQYWHHTIINGIKQILDSALQFNKKNSLNLINNVAQNAYSNIIQVDTTEINVREILRRINNIKLNADRDINNAGSLTLVEQKEQENRNLLNRTVNKVIGKVDNFKLRAHQRVNQTIISILRQVKESHYLSEFGKRQTINHITKVINDLDYKINEDKDNNIDNDINYYLTLVHKILKRVYIKEFNNITKSAHLQIKKMSALSFDNKRRAIKAIGYINQQIIRHVNQLDNCKMVAEIVRGGQHSIEKIVYQISDLDPVKHTAHSLINSIAHNLNEQIRDNHDLENRSKKKILSQILDINKHTNIEINQSNDIYINRIVHKGHQKFARIALNNSKNANINRINQITQDSKRQIDQMDNLAPIEQREAYYKINRCYHETIHNLNQAKNTARATQAEQDGERKINTIYDRIVGSNSFKQAAYDAITKKANDASSQIKDFNNLNNDDKKTGSRLLSKIKQQTIQDINGAYGVHDVYVAENKGTTLIRQVIDKISSADVMVSAVQSAHERISHSNLGRQQKQRIINQINAMISSGINDQKAENDIYHKSSDHSAQLKTDKTKHKSNQPAPHYRYIVNNQSSSAHHQHSGIKSKLSSKHAKSKSASMDNNNSTGYSSGYRDGLNGHDEHWDRQRSSDYIKKYQKGYRLGHGKYIQAYHSGARAGRIRGMIAEPMIKLHGLSRGYIDGYVKAYRDNKVTLPVKVYAKRPLYLHHDIYFSPSNRIKKFHKHQSFKISKIIRRNDGSLCYKVSGGYITADPTYITNVLASSIPRVVKVINPHGIYMHKSKHFDTGNIMKLLSRGTHIRVADVVQDGNKRRFQLKNGFYITSDRNQVKKAWL